MLLGFYSGLIVFILLFITVLVFFIGELRKKNNKTNMIPKIMLGVLLLFTLTISSIYSFDFYKLQIGEMKYDEGLCHISFVNGRGKSIDTTEIRIDKKIYKIKSDQYKNLPDGNYYCELTYLPVTKIVSDIEIKE